MNELNILKAALAKQANRIASLTLDLDFALVQLELLSREIKAKDEGTSKTFELENEV